MDRDYHARLRDLTATARDEAAEARDRWAEERTAALMKEEGASAEAIRVFERSTGVARALATADRARAAADRELAARDREQAALDRRHARIDLRQARFDDLTGAYSRDWGQIALRNEIERARRSGEPLVLAFLAIRDDAPLPEVMSAVASRLRPYDPIVRMSEREFVCGLSGASLEPAERRMNEIQATLSDSDVGRAISVGLAELGPDEAFEQIAERGAAELARAASREQQPS